MKDNKKIIEIDGKKYAIDCTFNGSPAIYQHTNNGFCYAINNKSYTTHVKDLTAGKQDFVIILARKV
jgi:hypothetical protein